MRNLRNTQRSVLRSPDGLSLTAAGWDVGADHSIVCAFGPTPSDPLVQLKRRPYTCPATDQPAWEQIASWDALCPLPDLDCDKILDLHLLDESQCICLVFAGGDLVVVRENPLEGEEKIEIVGSVDVGITAAAWSPDGELLAITTNSDTLLYMTKDFENVLNVAFSEGDLKASKHVSVGWGKKETQFKGRGAKALRDPTMPETVDEGLPSPFDDNRSTISWRGDGAFVVINSTRASPRRVLRVYSREGQLDGVSEPVDRLEGALAWRPAGNIIAGVQRFDKRIDIIFFERNGLRHGEFSLRVHRSEMDTWASSIALEWNVDSSVLAVCFLDRVQLWTMGNYHYYLKQEVSFPFNTQMQIPVQLKWHQERPLAFVIDGPGN
jgi:elongator complex protein 1